VKQEPPFNWRVSVGMAIGLAVLFGGPARPRVGTRCPGALLSVCTVATVMDNLAE
jgi:hypothetical protein